jgi:hypothetical protein
MEFGISDLGQVVGGIVLMLAQFWQLLLAAAVMFVVIEATQASQCRRSRKQKLKPRSYLL